MPRQSQREMRKLEDPAFRRSCCEDRRLLVTGGRILAFALGVCLVVMHFLVCMLDAYLAKDSYS
jgi:hypothetical protein